MGGAPPARAHRRTVASGGPPHPPRSRVRRTLARGGADCLHPQLPESALWLRPRAAAAVLAGWPLLSGLGGPEPAPPPPTSPPSRPVERSHFWSWQVGRQHVEATAGLLGNGRGAGGSTGDEVAVDGEAGRLAGVTGSPNWQCVSPHPPLA